MGPSSAAPAASRPLQKAAVPGAVGHASRGPLSAAASSAEGASAHGRRRSSIALPWQRQPPADPSSAGVPV